jgi:hypothetical protein
LLSGTTWAENPRSRTRRLITNVRLLAVEGVEARVTANFAVWRFQHDQSDVYVGRYLHVLVHDACGLLFQERRAVLDLGNPASAREVELYPVTITLIESGCASPMSSAADALKDGVRRAMQSGGEFVASITASWTPP